MSQKDKPNGTADWQQQFQVSPGQTGASVPAVTMNKGSENIAEVDTSGNLDFDWKTVPGTSTRRQ